MSPVDHDRERLPLQVDGSGSRMSAFDSYRFGPFVLDARRWRLERAGDEVALQPKVFKALLYFLQRPRVVIAKEQLLADLWPGAFVTDGVLTRCIKHLRDALDDDARDPRFIRTVPRVGYEFATNVRTGAVSTVSPPASLAVLPFRSLVAGDRDEALELGMADGVIGRLSGLRQLVVRPLSAVARYGAVDRDAIAAGREQGVDAVVDGDWQLENDRFRVSVRALRVSDATTLLEETFEVPVTELQILPETISNRVAHTLRLELTPADSERLTRRDTDKPSAYRCYLLGRLHASRHTPDDERAGIELFGDAVKHDPGYALAWAALADSHVQLGTMETDAGHFDIARRHAMRALALQPDLVRALTSLGNIAWLLDWDWSAAEVYFRRGVASGAGDAELHIAYSDFCAYMRRDEEAIDAATRALEIDPNSAWVNALLAQALHFAGLHDEAIAQAHRAFAISPDFAFAHLFAGLAELTSRRYARGVEHLRQAHESSARTDFAGALGCAYGLAGRHQEARRILRELEASGDAPRPIELSLVHLGLGEHERALDLLEQALEARDWHVLLLHSEPIFRELRAHPRAIGLLERLKLPS